MSNQPQTLRLGTLTGKLLVFGGAYSNLQALSELQGIASRLGIPPDNILCTGDVVGYCAQPEECVQLVKGWGIRCISGNVEQNIVSGEDDCGCNYTEGGRCDLFSRTWFPYAVRSLSQDSVRWMAALPQHLSFNFAGKPVTVVHGSPAQVSEYVFRSTPWATKKKHFETTQSEVILAGHAGLPFADEQDNHIWLNAGVIGMPANDGTPRVWYLLLDDADGNFSFSFEFFTYDNAVANRLMLANDLPQAYAQTLLTGIWDNCEILPEAEKKLQGVSLSRLN
ncbi:metallophosphoesterase family protein [Persicitalea jodogahamensis]|uniref:Metallophosphatase family protein n=1 Tax=Persicitalea jodogahamensis TaxID=402147 RepID=A0A8J3D7V1_9BACT|nr:metallophosphoesterase family protein [Persicitalea jodogahamensis]GHB73358.1 metallophosphatase family protein [Persicitalea jodogahamensis]